MKIMSSGSRRWQLLKLLLMIVGYLVARGESSKFPERECCDPIYPMPDPTSRLPTVPTPTGKSGEFLIKISRRFQDILLLFEDTNFVK